MTLKDWKLDIKSNIRPEWENKKNFNRLHMYVLRFPNERWFIYVEHHGDIILKQKSFKTKSKALAYAKSYMIKH